MTVGRRRNFFVIVPNYYQYYLYRSRSYSAVCKTRINLNLVELNDSGELSRITCSHPKTEFCAENGLQVRDLRQLEVAHSTTPNLPPAILSRGQSIFVSLVYTKAIIKQNCVKFIQNGSLVDENMPTFFNDLLNDLQEQLVSPQRKVCSFEFLVLECLLDHMSIALSRKVDYLQSGVDALLLTLEKTVDRESLKSLLLYNKELTKFQSIATSIRSTIDDLLQSDTDMAAMYLSRTATIKQLNYGANNITVSAVPTQVSEHEELELLLEHFMRILDEIIGKIDDLLQNIQSTEGISNIVLDSQRNALLRLELRLTICGFSMGFAGLGASCFGMNLQSHLEHHPSAFYWALGSLCSVSGFALVACWRRMNTLIRESQ